MQFLYLYKEINVLLVIWVIQEQYYIELPPKKNLLFSCHMITNLLDLMKEKESKGVVEKFIDLLMKVSKLAHQEFGLMSRVQVLLSPDHWVIFKLKELV